MEHPCPNCKKPFKSRKRLYAHMAIDEESSSDGTPIMQQSILSLERTKDRVQFLLKKIPATRNSDWLLYLYLLRYWGQALVYDPGKKLIQFRNPEGITYEEFVHLPSWETCRRSRQSVVAKHPELQPSDEAVAIRRAKEKGYHGFFASERLREGDWLPDTYVPDSKGL